MTDSAAQLRGRVEEVLDRLRPALIADGGGVELVQVDAHGTVQVALLGACATCPAQLATLRLGLEQAIRSEVPEIRVLVPVSLVGTDPSSHR